MSESTIKKAAKPFAGRKARRTVSVEQLQPLNFAPLDDQRFAPLVISANQGNFDLVNWLEEDKSNWQKPLHEHGAVLFRGFGLQTVDAVAKVAKVVMVDLFKENTEHVPVSADGLVQVPVDYAKDKFLLWHNENTFNNSWPQQAIFACAVPAQSGGETPVADSRAIFDALDADIRQQFIDKQVMYVRKYGTEDRLGLSWKTIFKTDDKQEVEKSCEAQKMDFEWLENDELLTRSVRPAVWQHPVSGQWCWINQVLHWHFSCLDEQTRTAISKLYEDEKYYPRNCYFGDGSKIPDDYIAIIMDLYREHQTQFPWQTGDLLLVDNILKAHARNVFEGERKIMVCFGGMETFA